MLKPIGSDAPDTGGGGLHLPDPATKGPYRPFTTDPGWSEAWWWLGVPVLFAIWLLVTWQIAPGWYSKWVIPEGYGILEFSQFVTMLAALFIAVRLLFKPFVRKRPFVFAVTIISALSCLYIAGEEMSWGQHFFHWKTPEYWAMVNRQEETNLHNIYPDLPRFRAMATGGSRDWRRDRRHHRADCRSLLPAHPRQPAVAVPATGSSIAYAVIAMLFKFTGILSQKGYMPELVHRPSEAVELYLYYFILGYLIIYARRIKELEVWRY